MSHYDEDMGKIVEPKIKDMINHPAHYNKHPSGIECKDVIEHFSYHLGCAVKYIWRCDEKGLPIQDLKKAMKSIQFEIDMRERKQ